MCATVVSAYFLQLTPPTLPGSAQASRSFLSVDNTWTVCVLHSAHRCFETPWTKALYDLDRGQGLKGTKQDLDSQRANFHFNSLPFGGSGKTCFETTSNPFLFWFCEDGGCLTRAMEGQEKKSPKQSNNKAKQLEAVTKQK